MANYRNSEADAVVEVAKALSDPQRLRALLALRGGELCVCQLIELLGLSPSTVSKHMSILAGAGLVRHRKEGRWVLYRIDERESPPEARGVLRWLEEFAPESDADRKRLESIRRADPAFLCSVQRKRAGALDAGRSQRRTTP